MTSPHQSDPAARARGLFEDARVAEAGVDSASAALFRLGGDVARAGTRREIARFGVSVAVERELMSGLLDELLAIAASADELDGELGRDADGQTRLILADVRRIVSEAGDRGRDSVWIGELATDRVRDFAEFELLHSQASRHLARNDLHAADAVLPQLVALERALVAPEAAEMLDDLKFRRVTAGGDDRE